MAMILPPPPSSSFSDDFDFTYQEPQPSEKAILASAEIFKQHGFHIAIQECGNKAALDLLIRQTINATEARKIEIQARFKRRIDWHESQLTELKTRLEQVRGKQDAFQRLEEIRTQLFNTYRELGDAKRDLIKNRLGDWANETKELFNTEKVAYDDWWTINEKAFKDNKKRLEIISAEVERLRDKYIARYDEMDEQIQVLDIGGIDTAAYRQLLGTGVALVAGWFFSVYLLIINDFHQYSDASGKVHESFGNQDVWFFLLQSILKALDSRPVYAVSQILGFLGLIGIVVWICQYFLQTLDTNKNAQKFAFDLDNESNLNAEEVTESIKKRFRFSFTSNSMFALFLQAAPILLALGLLFVVLKMGRVDDNVDKLDASLAGQFVGTVLAFGASGIVLLFFSKIKDLRQVRWTNYVVITCVLLFPFIFLLPVNLKQQAILGFVLAIVISATTMAFGIRFRGLRKIEAELVEAIEVCTQIIARYSSPIPVGIHSNEFRLKFKHIQNELLDWIKGKNASVRNMQENPGAVFIEKRLGRWRRFKDWFVRRDHKSAQPRTVAISMLGSSEPSADEHIPSRIQYLELDAYEKQNFPEYDKKITAFKYEYDEIRVQSQAVGRRGTELEKKFEDVTNLVFKLQRNQTYAINIVHKEGISHQNWIREGFELGLWYLKNNLFAQRDCPPLYLDLPPIPKPGLPTLLSLEKPDGEAESSSDITLSLTIDEDFENYKVTHLDNLLSYIKSIFDKDFKQPNIIGLEKGSVIVTLVISQEGFVRFITFFNEKIRKRFGVIKYEFSSTEYDKCIITNDDERLVRIIKELKKMISIDLGKGIKEIGSFLDESCENYNEYLICQSRFNSLNKKSNSVTLSFQEFNEEYNKISLSLLEFVDKLRIECIRLTPQIGNNNADRTVSNNLVDQQPSSAPHMESGGSNASK